MPRGRGKKILLEFTACCRCLTQPIFTNSEVLTLLFYRKGRKTEKERKEYPNWRKERT